MFESSDLRRREILHFRSVCPFCPGGGGGGGGGGGTLIFSFSYILRLGLFFGGFKILNFNLFWGFQKTEYFLG